MALEVSAPSLKSVNEVVAGGIHPGELYFTAVNPFWQVTMCLAHGGGRKVFALLN